MVEDDPITAIGYGLSDNRSSELGERDDEVLAMLLQSLDLDEVVTGFDDSDLDELLDEINSGLYGTLPPTGAANDPNEEWEGMPEFENEPKAARTLYIHFAKELDVAEFAKTIKQSITESTKSLWYPQRQTNLHMDKTLVYETE
jgi:hypothetical protein